MHVSTAASHDKAAYPWVSKRTVCEYMYIDVKPGAVQFRSMSGYNLGGHEANNPAIVWLKGTIG